MNKKNGERGQALILIVFAIIGLIGMTAVTVDAGIAYSDRRHAQNAADSAALAAALAHVREENPQAAAQAIITTNGYDGGDITVTVTTAPVTTGCPAGTDPADNLDITVQIVSNVDTTFAPVVGIQQVTNTVSATTRACGTYVAPLFNGDAIVALNPSASNCGIDTGNSNAKTWTTTGGGVFSNGCLRHVNGTLNIPNDKCLTAVAGATVTGGGAHACVQQNQSGLQYDYPADIAAMMPPNPCTGVITSGRYAGGGKVPTSGQTTFNNDIFCIDDMDGFFGSPFHGDIVLNNSTLYVTDQNFSMKFNGGGDFTGTATTTAGSPYKGYYMVIAMAPVTASSCQQNFEMRGNGDADIVGTIFAPSACFDAKGNSGTGANRSQFIFYMVSSNGNANIKVDFNAGENHQDPQDPAIQLLK